MNQCFSRPSNDFKNVNISEIANCLKYQNIMDSENHIENGVF